MVRCSDCSVERKNAGAIFSFHFYIYGIVELYFTRFHTSIQRSRLFFLGVSDCISVMRDVSQASPQAS